MLVSSHAAHGVLFSAGLCLLVATNMMSVQARSQVSTMGGGVIFCWMSLWKCSEQTALTERYWRPSWPGMRTRFWSRPKKGRYQWWHKLNDFVITKHGSALYIGMAKVLPIIDVLSYDGQNSSFSSPPSPPLPPPPDSTPMTQKGSHIST